LSAQKVAQKSALAACLFVARMIVTGADGTGDPGQYSATYPDLDRIL